MTPKQHQFAREVVLGKSQADAYRSAYNTLKMNDNSIRRDAAAMTDRINGSYTHRRSDDGSGRLRATNGRVANRAKF